MNARSTEDHEKSIEQILDILTITYAGSRFCGFDTSVVGTNVHPHLMRCIEAQPSLSVAEQLFLTLIVIVLGAVCNQYILSLTLEHHGHRSRHEMLTSTASSTYFLHATAHAARGGESSAVVVEAFVPMSIAASFDTSQI